LCSLGETNTALLESLARLSQQGVNELLPEDIEEALGVMTRSFAGTASTEPEMALDWLLGPQVSEQWDDPRRVLMTYWVMKSRLSLCVRHGGIVLVARNQDGTIGAVCLVKPYVTKRPPSALQDFVHEAGNALFHVGLPPCGVRFSLRKNKAPLRKCLGRGMEKRMDVLGAKQVELHRQHGRAPHWFVDIMAVDPSAQGLGLCGKLMRAVSQVADDQGVQCFLFSSSARNNRIYERFGYKVVAGAELHAPADPDRSNPFATCSAMIRPVAIKS
jgi:GNAT superfamily N-acetyltransferase